MTAHAIVEQAKKELELPELVGNTDEKILVSFVEKITVNRKLSNLPFESVVEETIDQTTSEVAILWMPGHLRKLENALRNFAVAARLEEKTRDWNQHRQKEF